MSWQHIATIYSKYHEPMECAWCGKEIPAHTEAVVETVLEDGKTNEYRFHVKCYDAYRDEP